MAEKVIKLDGDEIKENLDTQYQILVKVFGREVAKEILESDDNDEEDFGF